MFIFFGDAIVSFNEIIALINKRKWVWNVVAFKLFILISPDGVNYIPNE